MLQLRDWYDDLSAFLLGDWSMAGGIPGTATYSASTAFGQNANGSWTSNEWPIVGYTDLVRQINSHSYTRCYRCASCCSYRKYWFTSCTITFDVDGSDSYHQSGQKSIVDYLWDWDESDGVDWKIR